MSGVQCVKIKHICHVVNIQKDKVPAMYSIFIYLFN